MSQLSLDLVQQANVSVFNFGHNDMGLQMSYIDAAELKLLLGMIGKQLRVGTNEMPDVISVSICVPCD